MTNKEEKPSLKPVTVRAAGSPEGKDGKHGETATDATGHYAELCAITYSQKPHIYHHEIDKFKGIFGFVYVFE